jgi:hypothetical protein
VEKNLLKLSNEAGSDFTFKKARTTINDDVISMYGFK